MKRKLVIKLAAVTAFFATFAVSSSLAWFSPTVSVTDSGDVSGTTEGAYYAYGEGTEEKPFGITKPRHLYNLAWLHYLGTYNKSSDNGKPFYFELGDNIDMTDWVLPPIGDENNPFYGNFNGNGYVISNLTISNDFENDLGKHPSTLTSFTQPHILGFFGVIGKYGSANPSAYSTSANEFINTGLTGLTIKTVLSDSLLGIAAGYVKDGDATDSHTVLKNIVVDDSQIGLPSSGTTSSYGNDVNGTALTDISEYSLVGYTNNKSSVVKASKSVYGVNVDNNYTFNATESGNANGWGGSVDMKSVLERLITIKGTKSKAVFPFKKTYTHHEGTGAVDESTTNTSRTGSGNYAGYPSTLVNDNDQIGHFLFLHRNDAYDPYYAMFGGGHLQVDQYYKLAEHTGRYITDGTNYLCLSGTTLTNGTDPDTATLWNFERYSNGVYYITTTYNGTTYYINYNNGALNTQTSTGTSRRWRIDDSGTYRDIKYNGGTSYHLTYQNGWTLINTSGNPYYVIHDGNGHYMGTPSSYVPSNVTEANALKFGYTATGNTRGYYSQSNTNLYLAWRRARDPLYMRNGYNNGSYRLYPSTSSTTIVANGYGTGYLRTTTKNSDTPDNNNYYVQWSNNTWTATTTAANATQVTIDYIDPTAFTAKLSKTSDLATPRYGPDETMDSDDTTYEMNYEGDDVTYFPLSTVNNTDDFRPADSNTAYIVSGSSIANNATNIESKNSIVRFSNLFGLEQWTLGSSTYPKSLSDDFNLTTGEFTNIYTIVKNGNNLVRSSNIANDYTNYPKLKDAKATLGEVMKTANNPDKKAYGVHFMDAAISMDALTTAKYVKVNGKEYTNYQLPVNSIDFNLKEFGYINFMAGTYYRNSSTDRNDSFFALYQVERPTSSPNTISRILEIKNVYQHTSKNKTYSYVYELYDGENTFYTKPYVIISSEGDKEWLYDTTSDWEPNQYVNSLPTNYTKVFDVDVIKQNDIDGTYQTNDFDYHPFYFEIPMNDGEFCLGSVDGATGAYLMYLDIAANAAKTNRTITYEQFTITQKTYSHPVGVVLQPLPTTTTAGVAVINVNQTVDVDDSVCMEIKPTANGNYSLDRTDNTVAVTRSNTTLAPPVYVGEGITLSGSGDLEPSPISSDVHDIQRMQYFDYLINTNSLCVTTFTDYYSTSGTFENRVIEQNRYSGIAVNDTPTSTLIYDPTGILGTEQDDSADMKIYNTSTGLSIAASAFTSSTQLAIDDSRLSDDVILEFKLLQDGNSYTDVTTLVVAHDNLASQTETYYKYESYAIVLTPDSGTITVTIIDYEGSFTTVTYNDSTAATTSSTATTVITINGTTVTGEEQVITITVNP